MADCPDRDHFPLRGSDDRPAVWCFDPRPGSTHIVILVGPTEFDAILERGYATLDGIRADPVLDQCDREVGWMRFCLERPYERPIASDPLTDGNEDCSASEAVLVGAQA